MIWQQKNLDLNNTTTKPITNNMTQQTAVEWFAFQIMDSWNDIQNGKISIDELIQQAKQMEKEQIMDAHIEGQRVFDKHPHTHWTNDQAEQYYNETYGK